MIESRDAIFDENRFTSSPRPREIDQEDVDPSSDPMEAEEPTPALGPRVTRSMTRASLLQAPSIDVADPKPPIDKDSPAIGPRALKRMAMGVPGEDTSDGRNGEDMNLTHASDDEAEASTSTSHTPKQQQVHSAHLVGHTYLEPIF